MARIAPGALRKLLPWLKARRWDLLGLVSCGVLACVLTWPAIIHLDDRVIGDFTHPATRAELGLEYIVLTEVQEGNLRTWYRTDAYNYPDGHDLGERIAHSLNLLATVPFGLLLDTLPAHNLFVIVMLAANAMAMFLLARSLSMSVPVSLVAAFFYLFNGYMLLKLDMGFIQKTFLVWIPLYFMALFRMLRDSRISSPVAAGFWLFLAFVTYPTYAAHALLATGLFAVYLLAVRRNALDLLRLPLIAVVFVALSVGWDLLFACRPLYYLSGAETQPLGAIDWSIDLLRLPRFMLGEPTNRPCGISVIALAAAVYAARRMPGLPRFLLAVTAAFVCIAIGPEIRVGDRLFPAPLHAAYSFPPLAAVWQFPIRILPLINTFLALSLGFALTRLLDERPARIRAITSAGVALALVIEIEVLLPELLPVTIDTPSLPAFFYEVADEDFEALLHVPFKTEITAERYASSVYDFWTAVAHKKMINAHAKRSDQHDPLPGASAPPAHKRQYLSFLAQHGVGYIVYHGALVAAGWDHDSDDTSPPADVAWLSDYCGQPRWYDEGALTVWKVPNER